MPPQEAAPQPAQREQVTLFNTREREGETHTL